MSISPDYEHYLRLNIWNIFRAACLIVGLCPDQYFASLRRSPGSRDPNNDKVDELKGQVDNLIEVFKDGVNVGLLEPFSTSHNINASDFEPSLNRGYAKLRREDAVTFAAKRGYQIPDELQSLIQADQSAEETESTDGDGSNMEHESASLVTDNTDHPCKIRDDENFPPELAAALSAWEWIYLRGEVSNLSLSHTQMVKNYLAENYSELSDKARIRISSVVAPRRIKEKRSN
jgi:hypothetical protein